MPSHNHETNGHAGGDLKASGPSGDGAGKSSRNGWGGARARSGRKPSAAKMKRKELHERMAEDAEFAFDLVGQIARDPEQNAKLRLHAAELLMNRAWGKPRQGID